MVLLLMMAFWIPVQATDIAGLTGREEQALGVDKLKKAGESYLSDVNISSDMNVREALNQIMGMGKQAASNIIRSSVRSCMLLLAITLMCGLAEGMRLGAGDQGFPVVPVVAALSVTAVAVSDMSSLVGMGKHAIEEMELFSDVLLPTVTMSTAFSGAPTAAAVRQLATVLFSNCLINLINNVLLPLTFAYIAAGTAYAAVGNEGLKRIGSCIKWIITTTLAIVLLAFTGYISVSGVIAGGADAAAVKAAKFTISNMVPVVGSIISDSAETLLVGASILRNAIGIFGMLVVLAICLVPFLHLGAHYITYKITAALTATVSSDGRVTGLIDTIGSAFGLVMGMTGACAMVLAIAMISAISAVSG